MNIILINGSPRLDGNTKTALNKINDSIIKNTEHNTEFIDVAYKNIKGCVACDFCRKNDGKCVQKDDTNELMEKLFSADIIIFGTPVYFWGISAQLKLLIDKFYCNKQALYGKKIGVIAIGASGLQNPQYRLIKEQFECIAKFLQWEIIFSESASAHDRGDILESKEKILEFESIWGKI